MPIEHVPRKITGTFIGLLDKIDLILLQRETFWIRKINPITSHGLNKHNELPPPVSFSTKFSDQVRALSDVKYWYIKICL